MAKAVKNEKKVEFVEEVRMVPQYFASQKVVQEESVTLEMTMEEARTLCIVTGKIGGCPDNSRRKDTESIRKAICKHIGKIYGRAHTTGTLYFSQE